MWALSTPISALERAIVSLRLLPPISRARLNTIVFPSDHAGAVMWWVYAVSCLDNLYQPPPIDVCPLSYVSFGPNFSSSDVNINSTDDSHVVAHTSAVLSFS